MFHFFAAVLITLMLLGAMVVIGGGLAVAHAFVLSKLWLWFVVPVFGLPALGLWQSLGLGTFIGFLLYRAPPEEEEPTTKEGRAALTKKRLLKLANVPIRLGAVLLAGYLVKTFLL